MRAISCNKKTVRIWTKIMQKGYCGQEFAITSLDNSLSTMKSMFPRYHYGLQEFNLYMVAQVII